MSSVLPMIKGIWQASRVANMPTILTNALVVNVFFFGEREFSFPVYAVCCLIGLGFYLVGMWGNDVADARWDRQFKPHRPIPQKLIDTKLLLFLLVVVMVLSSGAYLYFCQTMIWPLVILYLSIYLYNRYHKSWSGAALLMGCCRGAWVLCAAMIIVCWKGIEFPSGFWWYPLALALYTAMLTLIARQEHQSEIAHRWVKRLLGGMCLFDALFLLILGSYLGGYAVLAWGASLVLQRVGVRSS